MSIDVGILGANGFIGSNLTERILQRRDWNVFGLDLRSDRLERFARHERFHFTEADITSEPEAVDALVARCDVVLPLAAIATPISYVRHPLSVFELTFEANLHVVRSCVRQRKRVVFPSSSEVYGMTDDAAFDEDTTRLELGPINKHRWIYACSKQLLDRVIHAYGMEKRLRYTIFRPFNWIGPGLDSVLDPREGSSRVVTQFIGNIMRGEDLRLVDGGYQRRCFLYIDDALNALERIIENTDGCADQRIFNVGNPRNDISIRDLADLLLELVVEHPGYEDAPRRISLIDVSSKDYYGEGYQDIASRTPAIRHAARQLGWEPHIDLHEALRKTLADALVQTAEPAPRRKDRAARASVTPVGGHSRGGPSPRAQG